MDAITQPPPPRSEEPDTRNSLRHILAAEPSLDDAIAPPPQSSTQGDDSEAPLDELAAAEYRFSGDQAQAAGMATTRQAANGGAAANASISSVYSGNKIRHLKKEDGLPLWRKDIQYDFLRYVFEDDRPVFHKTSDGSPGHTFADIYLDAMANSSKCSKILKEKLLTERLAAVNMAMVCLLVNVGRMNTTLNCA